MSRKEINKSDELKDGGGSWFERVVYAEENAFVVWNGNGRKRPCRMMPFIGRTEFLIFG